MPTLAQFLISITGTLAKRVLVALGFAVFSYASISTTINAAISSAQTSFNGLPSDVLLLLNLAGIGQALGIIAAGLTTRASLMAINKLRPQ